MRSCRSCLVPRYQWTTGTGAPTAVQDRESLPPGGTICRAAGMLVKCGRNRLAERKENVKTDVNCAGYLVCLTSLECLDLPPML